MFIFCFLITKSKPDNQRPLTSILQTDYNLIIIEKRLYRQISSHYSSVLGAYILPLLICGAGPTLRGRLSRDRMVYGSKTTRASSAYHH